MLTKLVGFVQKLAADPIVERAGKTFVETVAAQAALYSTVVPNSPGVAPSAAVAAGATVLSVIWNLLVRRANKKTTP